MPLFEYDCGGCGRRESAFRSVESRNRAPKCGVCGGKTKRAVSAFRIVGQDSGETLYDFQKDKWELATGKRHQSEADVEKWAKANGKEIVAPGWKPKPVDPMTDPTFDREVEQAIDKVYDENHRIEVSG